MNELKQAASLLNEAAPPGERLIYANPAEELALKNMGGQGAPAAGGIPSYMKGQVSPSPRDWASQPRLGHVAPMLAPMMGGHPLMGKGFSSKGQVSPSPRGQPSGGFDQPAPSPYGPAQRYNPRSVGVPSYDPQNPQDNAIAHDNDLSEKAHDLNAAAPEGERLAYINPSEEKLLKALGGAGNPAAGGIPSYKKGKVSPPPPRNYGQETRDTLQAQVDLAPQLYASEAKYRPQYADLERGMQLEQMGIDPSKGLLQAYEEDIAPSMARQKAATVGGDIDILRQYGPQLLEAQREADPLADSLRTGIMESASEDLFAGQGLTATERMDLDQQVLAGAADRGMEGQASTLQQQIGQRLSADRGVKQQRLSNAANAYRLGAGDIMHTLTGRASQAPQQAMAQFGSAGFSLDSSPGIFNPESNYAGNLATQNWQGTMDARTATAANKANMWGSFLGAAGNVAGRYAGRPR
jgi:hypothetical protein